ncbi:MAG: SGNH/GDSL hydrolase family protein [Mobilitalea sp.]
MKDNEINHEVYHKIMLERSLINIGNNFNIKRVLQKAKHGDEITIAYLGGSITEQKPKSAIVGYATNSYEYFKERFGVGGKINYVNAGMNGTTSIHALIRIERDVLCYRPDIVFVEFAVNDSKESLYREAFESLIRRLLQDEGKPAIILLFMLSESGYSCQGHMQALGEYYDLPMISIGAAIQPEIEAKRMSWRNYSDDNIHPNHEGHLLVTKLIMNYYETMILRKCDEEIVGGQEPFYGESFRHMSMLDSTNIIVESMGSFESKLTIEDFKNGWKYISGTGNKCFAIRLKSKNLFAVFQVNNDISCGNAEIYIDGVLKGVLLGYSLFGWNNPICQLIFQEEKVMEHTIEIKMATGDEKKEFVLLAFGYCEK